MSSFSVRNPISYRDDNESSAKWIEVFAAREHARVDPQRSENLCLRQPGLP